MCQVLILTEEVRSIRIGQFLLLECSHISHLLLVSFFEVVLTGAGCSPELLLLVDAINEGHA